MCYKAIIFDLDGTLLNTLYGLAYCGNKVLSHNGFDEHPIESYKYFVGSGMKNLLKKALPNEHSNDETVEKIIEEFNELYTKNWSRNTCLYDGVEDLLNKLEEKNIKKSILSNKPNEFTQIISQEYFNKWDFKYIYGSFEHIPKKPDPTLALKIAEDININTQEIVYLGDSGIDMKTANNAHMLAVGCLWGFRDKDELVNSGAQKIISTPQEILDLF